MAVGMWDVWSYDYWHVGCWYVGHVLWLLACGHVVLWLLVYGMCGLMDVGM